MNASAPRPVLVIGSRNRKKTGELLELLGPHGIDVRSLADYPDAPEVVEDGTTFAENAAKKATEQARALGQWVLGEDSGLSVDALDGAPGIYSARYGGEGTTDEKNNDTLLTALAGVPPERRGAYYTCSIAVADPSGQVRVAVEATCRGRILEERRGTNGFGYDPLFLVREYHKTFGELSPAVKRSISHRARALQRLVGPLVHVLQRPTDK